VVPSIATNNIIGPVILNHISSSINYQTNYNNSPITINNHVSSSAIANNSLSVGANLFLGGSLGQGHSIFASGSQSSNATRNITDNLVGGKNNIISSSFVSSSNSNLVSTIMYGNSLAVSASHTVGTNGGSAFFGRFNATGSNQEDAQQVVFAVGTGTAVGARKTGFLIDSGSNTRISGSLAVNGNATITGSVILSGSLNPELIVIGDEVISGSLYIQSGSAFPEATGSALVAWNSTTGQVTQTPYSSALPVLMAVGAFYSTGSYTTTANQSGSFVLDTSLNVNSVYINGNGTHIVVDRTGTYNIQFSIQVDNGSGEANIAIWLKKNGTNVADTATLVTVPSNHKDLIALNLWDTCTAGDFYEIAYQSDSSSTTFATVAASGNIPRSPSIIVTVNQVR
jgi:hypothetical protein